MRILLEEAHKSQVLMTIIPRINSREKRNDAKSEKSAVAVQIFNDRLLIVRSFQFPWKTPSFSREIQISDRIFRFETGTGTSGLHLTERRL